MYMKQGKDDKVVIPNCVHRRKTVLNILCPEYGAGQTRDAKLHFRTQLSIRNLTHKILIMVILILSNFQLL